MDIRKRFKQIFGSGSHRDSDEASFVPLQGLHSQMLALEPRIVLDGALAATDLADSDDGSEPTPAPLAKAAPDAAKDASPDQAPQEAGPGRNLVFIDTQVEDYQSLVQGVDADAEIVYIGAQDHGLSVIADHLHQDDPVASVAIISHGSPGTLVLGQDVLNLESLSAEHRQTLSAWSTGLTDQADILLYGCDVAAGDDGLAFVRQLAELTGADVAASADDTGAAELGGDWDLEVETGAIEDDGLLFDAVAGYRGLLAGDAVPSATLSVPATSSMGEDLTFTVTFDNTSATITGYGPFIDLLLPATGEDGVDGTDPVVVNEDDGITFTSATYLGNALTTTTLTLTEAGVEHPYAVDSSGDALVILPGDVGMEVGDQLVVIQLPFGSFAPDQPTAAVSVTASLSDKADLGVAHTIKARGGFQFGNTAVADPATDETLVGSLNTDTVAPSLISVSTSFSGGENETASGPNFEKDFTVTIDVADGQTVTDLDVTVTLPDNIAYEGVAITGSGSATTEPPTDDAAHDPSTLVVNFTSITGGTGASFTLTFFVPEDDAADTDVLDPDSGNDVNIGIDVAALGDWTPIDTRDTGGTDNVSIDPVGFETDFDAKSIAVQESVSVVTEASGGPTGASPGDTLEYTINFQISDFFAFGDLLVTDIFSDGQLFDSTFTPTLSIAGGAASDFEVDDTYLAFDADNNVTVDRNADDDPSTPASDGSTTISFDLSQELIDQSINANGRLIGDLFDTDATLDTATTGTIKYRTVVQEAFTDDYPVGGDARLNEKDSLSSSVTISGDVLDTSFNTTDTESDGSGTSTNIVVGDFTIETYAINSTLGAEAKIKPGDEVTFRLKYDLSLGDFEDFEFTSYLPLPVFDIDDPNQDDSSSYDWDGNQVTLSDPSTDVPDSGEFAYGPDHTSDLASLDPTVSTDTTSNFINFDFGTRTDDDNFGETIDILFTLTVSDDPFADGLFLTHLATQQAKNTPQQASTEAALVQLELTEPDLEITKGVVATDANTTGTLAPTDVGGGDITWKAAGTSGQPFSGGTISSSDLSSTPIDSDLSAVDAGDIVRFVIVVENKGSSANGAFDTSVKDAIPAGFEAVNGSVNFTVYDGAGNELNFTDLGGKPSGVNDDGAGLFGNGIRLDDGASTGALGAFSASSGTNIAIIAYDLRVASTAEALSDHTGTATLFNYAGLDSRLD